MATAQPNLEDFIANMEGRSSTSRSCSYYKHMLGWNRRAVKITLPLTAGLASIDALQTLCLLSARSAQSACA
jgi:hypothetical protein